MTTEAAGQNEGFRNIINDSEEEILAVAQPMWDDLIKYSNEGKYGLFIKHFSRDLLREKCLMNSPYLPSLEYLISSSHIGFATVRISSSLSLIMFLNPSLCPAASVVMFICPARHDSGTS